MDQKLVKTRVRRRLICKNNIKDEEIMNGLLDEGGRYGKEMRKMLRLVHRACLVVYRATSHALNFET